MTITPPIIVAQGGTSDDERAETDYANATRAATAGDTVISLNTVTAPSNIFFQQKAVEIIHGTFATAELNDSGMSTMTESTDSGIQILFAKQSGINELDTKYRLTMWAAPNILIPDQCGVLVGNQT